MIIFNNFGIVFTCIEIWLSLLQKYQRELHIDNIYIGSAVQINNGQRRQEICIGAFNPN